MQPFVHKIRERGVTCIAASKGSVIIGKLQAIKYDLAKFLGRVLCNKVLSVIDWSKL